MDVSSACDGRMSDLVKGSYGFKQVYGSHNQIGNSIKSDTQESLFAELGNALNAILHVKDAQLHSPPACDQSSRPERHTSSSDIHINQPKLLSTTTQANLSKSPDFCPEDAPSEVPSVNTKRVAYDNTPAHKKGQNSENLVLEHPASLSVPKKLVSAMKGSREKLGTPPKKLSVTWAPDVYDPPVTSVSHSVKNHSQQRSSRSKKHSKRQKGKSSQGSSSGKRYHKHVGKSDHHHSKSSSPPTSSGIPIFGDYNSTLELLDFAVVGNDSKCGSSFLRTSRAEVHVPVAEAT